MYFKRFSSKLKSWELGIFNLITQIWFIEITFNVLQESHRWVSPEHSSIPMSVLWRTLSHQVSVSPTFYKLFYCEKVIWADFIFLHLTVCVYKYFVKRIFAKKLLLKLLVKLTTGRPSQATAKYNTRSQQVSHQQTCKSKEDLHETGFKNPCCPLKLKRW